MAEAVAQLGAWFIDRTLGRDQTGTYFAGRRDDGERATLYLPSAENRLERGEPLTQLLVLHREVSHRGLVRFRAVERDGSELFLVGDAVDEAMGSLRGMLRPASGHARRIGAALATALVAAHDGGLAHGGLELDLVLWAPERPPLILGAGLPALGIADRAGLVHGDVVALGLLLCALIAATPGPDGAEGSQDPDRALVGLLADPSCRLTMREAQALLAAGLQPRVAHGGDAAAELATVSLRPRADDTETSASERPTRAFGDASGAPLTGEPGAQGGSDAPGGHLGRYRILTRLGRGGMGEVLLAEDPVLVRGVAIKRIRPDLEHDRSFRSRLRREAQLAARLSHRAIVHVFDLITDDNGDHIVMEYVPGPSLATRLAGSPMALGEALRIAAELADALAYAHQQGVVHRDLKLENVLLGLDGQPKIADFGIAHRAPITGETPAARDGDVLGTSRAMSPEQIQGEDIDARSDLFSFGVLLYELVTGASPFAAGTDTVTLLRVLNDRPLPVHARVPAVPAALSELIDQLLEKSPARRPDSARTVRDRLRRMLDTQLGRDVSPALDPTPPPASALPVAPAPAVAAVADAQTQALPRSTANPIASSWRRADHAAPATGMHQPVAQIGRPRPRSRILAPFVLAEIRALRSSVFKKSPEIQAALAIADKVEQAYDLERTDLFIPATETFCAILEPIATTLLTGTLRRVGYEVFPQWVAILGIPRSDVRTAMKLQTGPDVVRVICDAYSKCIVGNDAGKLVPTSSGATMTVTDTTILPCQLQMGVFLGAGKLTDLFSDAVLTERRCRARGDAACTYEFTFDAAPSEPRRAP